MLRESEKLFLSSVDAFYCLLSKEPETTIPVEPDIFTRSQEAKPTQSAYLSPRFVVSSILVDIYSFASHHTSLALLESLSYIPLACERLVPARLPSCSSGLPSVGFPSSNVFEFWSTLWGTSGDCLVAGGRVTMDPRWDPPDSCCMAAPALQRARQTRPTSVPQVPCPLLASIGPTLNAWGENLDLIAKKTTQQQPSEATKRYTPSPYITPTSSVLVTLNRQGLDSISETNTQQQQPTASRRYFFGTLRKKNQSYLQGLQTTTKTHYKAFTISDQRSPPRGRMPGAWPEDHISGDSTSANQTRNIHSGVSVVDSMGTSVSQSASELGRRQAAQISPEEQRTIPGSNVIGATPLLPKPNITGVSATPQPDRAGPPTNGRKSTVERDWSTIVSAARAFANKPKARRQEPSTATQPLTFFDSIDTDPEDEHTLRISPNPGVKEQSVAAPPSLGTAPGKPGQHIQGQYPPHVPLPETYSVQKAMREPSQLDNKPDSKLHVVSDVPIVSQQCHSRFTFGHQAEGSKPHPKPAEGKPVSKLPLPVKQSNENMKGPNLYPKKHNAMNDWPCSSTTPVLEEQATNSGAAHTVTSKQPQGFGNSSKSTKVSRTLEPSPKTPEDLPTRDAQGNIPHQARLNNNRLLDLRSLNPGAPIPNIRDAQALVSPFPDLEPPPPLPAPIKFQAGKENNETLGTPLILSRAVAKPDSSLPTQVPTPGRSGPPPSTVTAGTQATTSTQMRPQSQMADRKSLVTISAEFNPRLEASSIPKAPSFAHGSGVYNYKINSIMPGKSKQIDHSSGTSRAPFVSGELNSNLESSFKELTLTPHDWEEIEAQGRAQGNLTEQDLKWIKIFNKLQEKSSPHPDDTHDAGSGQPGTNMKEGGELDGDEKKKSKKAKKKAKKNRQKSVEDGKSKGGPKVYPSPTFQFGEAVSMGSIDLSSSATDYIVLPGNTPGVRGEDLRERVAARPSFQTTQSPSPGYPIARLHTLNPNPVIMMSGASNTAQPSTSMATNSGQSPKPVETASGAPEVKLHSFPPFPEQATRNEEDQRQTPKAVAPHAAPPPRQFGAGKPSQGGKPYMGTETKSSTSHPPLTFSKGRTEPFQAARLLRQSNLRAPTIPERFRFTNVAKPVVQSSVENSLPKPEEWTGEQIGRYTIACLERELMRDQVEAQYVTRLNQFAGGGPLKTVADGNAFKSYIKKYIEAYITSRVVRIFHEFQNQSFLTEELKDELQLMANRAIPMRQSESERLVEQFLNTFAVLMPSSSTVVSASEGSTQQGSVQAPQKEAKKSAFTENLDSKLKTTPASFDYKLNTRQAIEKGSKSANVEGIPAPQANSFSNASTRGAPAFRFTAGNIQNNKPTKMATAAVHQNVPRQKEPKGKQPLLRNPESKGKQPVSRDSEAHIPSKWNLDTSDDEPLEDVTKELQGILRDRDLQFLLSTVKPDVGYKHYLEDLAKEIIEGSRWSLRSKEEMSQFAKGLAYCPRVPVMEKEKEVPQITAQANIKFQRPNPDTYVQQVQNMHSALKPPFFKEDGKDEWGYERMYSNEYFRILNKMNPEAQNQPDEKAIEKVRLGKRKAESKDFGCGIAWCSGCQACPGRNGSRKSHPRGQALISMSNGDTILVETFVDDWKDTETFTLNPVSASAREGLRRVGVPFKPFQGEDNMGYGLDSSTQTAGACKGEYNGWDDGEELSPEKEEEVITSTLVEMEKGIRAKQENLMAELEKFKAEQEKTMAALGALTGGFGNEQVPVAAKALGAGPSKDKSGGKKKKKGKK